MAGGLVGWLEEEDRMGWRREQRKVGRHGEEAVCDSVTLCVRATRG